MEAGGVSLDGAPTGLCASLLGVGAPRQPPRVRSPVCPSEMRALQKAWLGLQLCVWLQLSPRRRDGQE